MKAQRLSDQHDGYVRLTLHKGVLVVLTLTEYHLALYRGKMERRRLRNEQRLAKQRLLEEQRQWRQQQP